MKRFYRAATVAPTAHGFGVLLDGKPVNTPSRRPLEVPTRAIAIGIAKEWNDQGEEIDLRAMGLTGLANSAIDRLGDDRAGFIDTLAAYGATDLLWPASRRRHGTRSSTGSSANMEKASSSRAASSRSSSRPRRSRRSGSRSKSMATSASPRCTRWSPSADRW